MLRECCFEEFRQVTRFYTVHCLFWLLRDVLVEWLDFTVRNPVRKERNKVSVYGKQIFP